MSLIDAKIEAHLPKINTDLSPAMERIAARMLFSLGQAHENQGYGTWSPTRDGKPATLSGLRKTERTSFGSDFAEIRFKNTIHQFGGLMNVTPKMRGLFWYRWFASKDDKWKWMALSKTLLFNVRPQVLQTSDIEFAKKELVNRIFNVTGSQGQSNWNYSY